VRTGPAALALVLAVPAAGAEVEPAVAVLETFVASRPHEVAEAAPPRFVLLEDGQVFVGGASAVAQGQLEKGELKALLQRLDSVRKLPALAGRVELGSGTERYRLLLRRGRPIDMTITGALDQAAPALRPLASLLRDLARFDHGTLRPYRPAQYALRAREAALPGGCRTWRLPEPPSASVFAPRVVPASAVEGWPTGAEPASVCHEDKRYVVTFRPMLPGE
jgi:hypothetical protein